MTKINLRTYKSIPRARNQAKAWKQNNRARAATAQRTCHLRRKYALSPQAVEELHANGCAICSSRKRLSVDHDHDTGEVRGSLCHACNVKMGVFDDDDFRRRALTYVREAEANPIPRSTNFPRAKNWPRSSSPEESRARSLERMRRINIRRHFGLNTADYDRIIKRGCAICSAPYRAGKGGTSIDHNHATGAIRGALCTPCNARLGKIESPGWSSFEVKALAYVGVAW